MVYHKESLSVGKNSLLKTYYMNRNRIVYLRRNLNDILDVCVIDTDFGLGIIKIREDLPKKPLSIDERSYVVFQLARGNYKTALPIMIELAKKH